MRGIARIVLDRPPLNVLDIPASRALAAALDRAGKDRNVRVIVLSGKGRCFSAGVDIADHTKARVKGMLAAFHAAVRALHRLEKPTIAAIHGHCLGGGMELALACDFALAERGAVLGLPEIRLACYPPVAAVLLPRRVGALRANELLLLGDAIPAPKALEMGLLNAVVPAHGLDKAVNALAARLMSRSGSALACAKAAIRAGESPAFGKALNAIERLYLRRLAKTADMEEGVRAFLAKRPPRWRHA